MLARMRTIDQAVEHYRAADPSTCITRWYVRQLILSKKVPSIMAGKKYLVNLDALDAYFSEGVKGDEAAPEQTCSREITPFKNCERRQSP